MLRYRKTLAWDRARALALAIYSAAARFPRAEQFGLGAQTRRAAVSIVANIAEGSAKSTRADYGRFLDNALGSLAELDALVDLAVALGFIEDSEAQTIFTLRAQTTQVTFALRRKLKE